MSELSKYLTKDEEAIRLYPIEEDFRTSFSRDIDRIINYASFTRYMNKTQVFSFKSNDNVQTRIVHVLLVSRISRTIGRALGLNEDLIEAAPKSDSAPSVKQYKAWLARAIDLKNRIDESNKIISVLADSPDRAREERKLSRYETKLSAIEAKITEYEDLMD